MALKYLRNVCATTLVIATLGACAQQSGMKPLASTPGGAPFVGSNLIKDGSFEKPVVPTGSYQLFSTGQRFSAWTVTGDPGDVGIVSGAFTQNGFTFPAACGQQWLDLTGVTQTATGVTQSVSTTPNTQYEVEFDVGNVYDPHGIFGTSSIVNAFIGSQKVLVAINRRGIGSTQMVWKRFAKTFTASGSSAAIEFLNGDPSTDTLDGLDCVSVRQL